MQDNNNFLSQANQYSLRNSMSYAFFHVHISFCIQGDSKRWNLMKVYWYVPAAAAAAAVLFSQFLTQLTLKMCYSTQRNVAFIALQYIALHYITSHYITLRYVIPNVHRHIVITVFFDR